MPKRGGTRPAEGMVTLPLLPVQPRSRTMLGKQDRGKVRDFYTQAKRENNLLESTYHVQARIGFKRSCTPSAIRLRPLDMLKALPPKADPGGNRLPGMPESPLFSQTTPLAAPPAEPISEEAISAAAAAPAAKAELGWLREQACGLLLQAGNDGTLEAALGNIRRDSRPGETAAQAPVPIEELREQAYGLLMQAGSDGTLAAALNNIRGETAAEAPRLVEELKEYAYGLLLQARNDGTLEAALGNIRGETAVEAPRLVEELREQAYSLLMQAGNDGRLEAALGNIRSETAAEATEGDAEEVEDELEVAESRKPSLQIAAGLAHEISLIAVEGVVKLVEQDPKGACGSPRSVIAQDEE